MKFLFRPILGVIMSCLMCLVIWCLGTAAFLLGGHGQSLLCQPLYDQPHYRALTELLDSGGIFYPVGGVFRTFAENESLKVKDVLRNCQRGEFAYNTFRLSNQFDVEEVINYKSWPDLKSILYNFSVINNHLEVLSPTLQINLQVLSSISNVNLTLYRSQLSEPIMKRDLGSFADQLSSVARQLSDPISTRKFDNLGFMARKVVQKEMQYMLDIRNRILFKITALEVLLLPLNKQVNQSLSHMKTIQFFLDNQGWQIAEKTSREFVIRIEKYLEELYSHVNGKLTKEIGKCRSLWEIFHASRFFICKLIVDPTNGISLSCFFLILLFILLAPVVIKLVELYRDSNEDALTSISQRPSRSTIHIQDDRQWSTQHTESPEIPLCLSGSEGTEPISAWIPGPREEDIYYPSPPRPPQIPPATRARTSRSTRRSREDMVETDEPVWSVVTQRRWV